VQLFVKLAKQKARPSFGQAFFSIFGGGQQIIPGNPVSNRGGIVLLPVVGECSRSIFEKRLPAREQRLPAPAEHGHRHPGTREWDQFSGADRVFKRARY
jgi:hypothetical protein